MDEDVKRCLKGVFRSKPPVPKYKTSWDPQLVLSYLEGLGKNSSLSLLLLTQNLAMLLALAPGQRIQTLSLILTDHLVFTEFGVEISSLIGSVHKQMA